MSALHTFHRFTPAVKVVAIGCAVLLAASCLFGVVLLVKVFF